MRENTGARVVFPTPSDEDKELITIIGKKEGVEAAKQELLKSIKDLVWRVLCLQYQISSLIPMYFFYAGSKNLVAHQHQVVNVFFVHFTSLPTNVLIWKSYFDYS